MNLGARLYNEQGAEWIHVLPDAKVMAPLHTPIGGRSGWYAISRRDGEGQTGRENRLGTDIGVEGPEVEVGVLSVHRVGAPRGGAQGLAWSVAADRGGAEEAAAQGGRGRPGHSGFRFRYGHGAAFSTLKPVEGVIL
jgi:hypothetical protein